MPTPAADRLPPIPTDQWTDAQRKAAGEFATMRGQEVFGPFAVMLRSPEVMLRAAAMGDYMRYRTSLPPALKAGLPPHLVAAVSKGRRPDTMSSDEAIVYEFSTELLRLQNVSDPTYAK